VIGVTGVTGKSTKDKKRYKGVFMFRAQLYTDYCAAYSKRQAWLHFCRRLVRKHGVNMINIMAMFNGSKDNYYIQEDNE